MIKSFLWKISKKIRGKPKFIHGAIRTGSIPRTILLMVQDLAHMQRPMQQISLILLWIRIKPTLIEDKVAF
jgi:hypothetical protein